MYLCKTYPFVIYWARCDEIVKAERWDKRWADEIG